MTITVLVPIDGSPLSFSALRYVLREFPNNSITVLHVTDLFEPGYGVAPDFETSHEPLAGSEEWYEQAEQASDRLFAEAREIADEYDREVTTVSDIGDPKRIILDYVDEKDVDHKFNSVWEELRDCSAAIDGDEVLVTTATERAFRIDSALGDRIVVEMVRCDEPRPLWRDLFEVLYNGLQTDSDGVSLTYIPVGVEPYVAVMSLLPRYAVDESDDRLRGADSRETHESPLRRPARTARTSPECVHDDAVLLADAFGRDTV